MARQIDISDLSFKELQELELEINAAMVEKQKEEA